MNKNMNKATYSDYRESAAYIREKIGDTVPSFAIILGSGLGDFAERLEEKIVIPYAEIPHFPVSTVSYQKGELVFGKTEGKYVLCMNGRFHFYEGWEMWQTAYPVGVFRLLGIEKMIITNAAGGIGYPDGRSLLPGDLVIVNDQIKLVADSPVRGANVPEFGKRFFPMQDVFDKDLIALAHKVAEKNGFSLKEGVYAYMTGPQYETPAEIRALKTLGANLVGMSTVPENIFASQLGMKLLCISCVTNPAAGVGGWVPNEEEVVITAEKMAKSFKALLAGVVAEG